MSEESERNQRSWEALRRNADTAFPVVVKVMKELRDKQFRDGAVTEVPDKREDRIECKSAWLDLPAAEEGEWIRICVALRFSPEFLVVTKFSVEGSLDFDRTIECYHTRFPPPDYRQQVEEKIRNIVHELRNDGCLREQQTE